MSAHNLLEAIEEYLDKTNPVAAKKKFASALNKYIDWRADAVIEERRRKISSDHAIKISELVVSTINPKTMLKVAPAPPQITDDVNIWFDRYKKWYNEAQKC